MSDSTIKGETVSVLPTQASRRWKGLACSALGAALIGSCCATVGGPAGASTQASGKAAKAPIVLGLLWQIKGESSFAINDYQEGALLAIRDINRAGGVDGHRITWFRESLSPSDPQAAISSFTAATDRHPTVLVGPTAPNQVQELAPQVDAAKVPVVVTTTADTFDINGTSGGSKYYWFVGPYNPSMVNAGVNYMVKTMKLRKIGLMGTNDSYGTAGVTAATNQLKKLNLNPFATALYSPIATDLTQQVLQMQGADGIFDWGYPNPLAVQVNELQQNHMDIPTMAPASLNTIIEGGGIKGAALNNAYAVEPCDPLDASSSPQLSKFVKEFKKAYGSAPTSQNGAWSYDAVQIAAAAVAKAKSLDPQKINSALGILTYSGGCSTYHADPAHDMAHQAVIARYNSAGGNRVVAHATLPVVASKH